MQLLRYFKMSIDNFPNSQLPRDTCYDTHFPNAFINWIFTNNFTLFCWSNCKKNSFKMVFYRYHQNMQYFSFRKILHIMRNNKYLWIGFKCNTARFPLTNNFIIDTRVRVKFSLQYCKPVYCLTYNIMYIFSHRPSIQ